jgi:hypothetical protein
MNLSRPIHEGEIPFDHARNKKSKVSSKKIKDSDLES